MLPRERKRSPARARESPAESAGDSEAAPEREARGAQTETGSGGSHLFSVQTGKSQWKLRSMLGFQDLFKQYLLFKRNSLGRNRRKADLFEKTLAELDSPNWKSFCNSYLSSQIQRKLARLQRGLRPGDSQSVLDAKPRTPSRRITKSSSKRSQARRREPQRRRGARAPEKGAEGAQLLGLMNEFMKSVIVEEPRQKIQSQIPGLALPESGFPIFGRKNPQLEGGNPQGDAGGARAENSKRGGREREKGLVLSVFEDLSGERRSELFAESEPGSGK